MMEIEFHTFLGSQGRVYIPKDVVEIFELWVGTQIHVTMLIRNYKKSGFPTRVRKGWMFTVPKRERVFHEFYLTGLILVVLSFFYPPLLLICLLTYLFSLIFDFLKNHRIERKKFIVFILVAIAILLVFFVRYGGGLFKLFTLKEIKNMQEFYPGGRKPLFFPSILQRWTNYESGLAVDYPLQWLFIIAFLIFL